MTLNNVLRIGSAIVWVALAACGDGNKSPAPSPAAPTPTTTSPAPNPTSVDPALVGTWDGPIEGSDVSIKPRARSA